jgi:subtilisin family serine protease
MVFSRFDLANTYCYNECVTWVYTHVQIAHNHSIDGNPAHSTATTDMRVRQAWALGYSGRGVTVCILDDGLQIDHPDIAPNYVRPQSIGNHEL